MIDRKNIKPFIKYCTVGVSGTFIDLMVLFVLVEFFAVNVILASVISFIFAVTNNFVLNKIWTFSNTSKNFRKLYIKFLIVSLVGLGITVACMHLFVNIFEIWYLLAKIITSGVVLFWNFLANKMWTFKEKQTHFKDDEKYEFDLSIVIPAYNEQNRIKSTLSQIIDFVNKNSINAEIIVVDDGSTDCTVKTAQAFKQIFENVFVLPLNKNRGKGYAVKTGVLNSRGAHVLFTDADNSTPIEEYLTLKNSLIGNKAIVIGSRYLKNSTVKIKQPIYRVVLGRAGNILIRFFLLEGISDTQCGFKLFNNTTAKEIFSYQKVRRFAFDMEILVIAKNLGYEIFEVPVSWFNSAESRVRPVKDAIRTLKDLVYIKLNLWSGRYSSD